MRCVGPVFRASRVLSQRSRYAHKHGKGLATHILVKLITPHSSKSSMHIIYPGISDNGILEICT